LHTCIVTSAVRVSGFVDQGGNESHSCTCSEPVRVLW
jgi:hypothetical protein